jgi:nicotinate-nucleotide--dimethylbenzimidazole phosphoribosyltransferase
MSLIDETIAAIAPPDAAARERLDRMTMPRGALGRVGERGV